MGRGEAQGDDACELELSSANVNCTPVGTPGMFTDNAYAHQIVMKPGLFVHLIENNNRWNAVYIDGRPHTAKEELEALFYGDQTARWEGDTLVIDSISIDTRAQIRDGWFHSEDLHVIKRLRRPSMNYLEYQVTIEDPKVLTKPWTSRWETLSLSANNERLSENFCNNNENVESSGSSTKREEEVDSPADCALGSACILAVGQPTPSSMQGRSADAVVTGKS